MANAVDQLSTRLEEASYELDEQFMQVDQITNEIARTAAPAARGVYFSCLCFDT